MYVNQIDNIIDQILDNLYFVGIGNDPTFKTIVDGKKINFVEYREQINKFIENYVESIDANSIKKLINNKENFIKIMDIIKRYVAYYYFLILAYYYAGTIKDYRNNLIQYSKLQENSTFTIKNFFDTENNYQIVKFFKIIKDASQIILMTPMQRKTLDVQKVRDAVEFLNSLGSEYVDNYLLSVSQNDSGEETIEINVHNLIKTIVFGEIYQNQEQSIVYGILNEIEESQNEYTYIDIIVQGDDYSDYDTYRQIFLGQDNADVLARDLFELSNDANRIPTFDTIDTKNSLLIALPFLTPIVDDFLRYHRDTERLDTDVDNSSIGSSRTGISADSTIPLTSNNNAKNVQLAILQKQRKKSDNTRAQLIVNKLDAISELYSPNVIGNPTLKGNIEKYFKNPLFYRKAVMHNYLDERYVISKIENMGDKLIAQNEYYLELYNIINNAYFPFTDFQYYGTNIDVTQVEPLNMIRYDNIEYQNQMKTFELDMHTATSGNSINIVGMTLGPLSGKIIQCVQKENLVDIRTTTFHYIINGKKTSYHSSETKNGYKAFLKMIRHLYIDTIDFKNKPYFYFYNRNRELLALNPDISNKVVYWTYDMELDVYVSNTYETLKSGDYRESVKYLNSIIYDKILKYLQQRLVNLILQHTELNEFEIQRLIIVFSNVFRLPITTDQQRDVFVNEYLRKEKSNSSDIIDFSETMHNELTLPIFTTKPKISAFRIRVDLRNPVRPREYVTLRDYVGDTENEDIFQNKCQHENDWATLMKLKSFVTADETPNNTYLDNPKHITLNKYNEAAMNFIEKYAIETLQLDYICNICGQQLPLKQFIQDGHFDSNSQRFVSSYIPTDVQLEDIKEYSKYKLIIRFMDALINRVSLITGTNMLTGSGLNIKRRRMALVKSIIDLILKHNSINMKKRISETERANFYHEKFNVNKDIDQVYFFELEPSILDFTSMETTINTEINRFKYNNLLLYFVLVFIIELNGSQISMMQYDKIGNVYFYLKHGSKLFGNLLIKRNINSMDTEPITKYPVLCYLLFLISYFLIKYKLWSVPGQDAKTFNPFVQKIIINSFVDLFNSVSIDAGLNRDDYIYLLISSKIYSQMNSTFKNNEIITLLKREQIKYASIQETQANATSIRKIDIGDHVKKYQIAGPVPKQSTCIPVITYKPSNGISFPIPEKIMYHKTVQTTNLTNCENGSYRQWVVVGKNIVSCKEKTTQVEATGDINLENENYYYNMNNIANRRCLTGSLHDFKADGGEFVCTICGRGASINYTHSELDQLADNLNRIENTRIQEVFSAAINEKKISVSNFEKQQRDMDALIADFRKETGKKIYGHVNDQVDKLINVLEDSIGANVNLDIDKYPVYLKENVYVIDHNHTGGILSEPIIIKQNENVIHFRENHDFFKMDVYYYTNRNNQIDVFYDAVTMKLLGYKEKHKEYVLVNRPNTYLIISPSIKNRIMFIGYQTQYIDIGKMFDQNSKNIKDTNQNYYKILNSLIRDHVQKVRSVIDKISSLIFKIKNYYYSETDEYSFDTISKYLEKIVSKYSKMLPDFKTIGENGDAFSEWNEIRELFVYQPINWNETSIRATENMYVNSELINYYDVSSNIMIYYLVNQLIAIINRNPDKGIQNNIVQMYIEIILYVYNIYNIDPYKNSIEIKRFGYVMDASSDAIDLMRKGQGLDKSKQLEEQLEEENADLDNSYAVSNEYTEEEIEDLREESQALDVERGHFANEDDDDYDEDGYFNGQEED